MQELLQDVREQNTTDLSIAKTAEADPLQVGADLTYRLTVINLGPNPAGQVEIVDVLPPEVSYKSDTAGCVEVPPGTLTCDLGALFPGELREIEISVSIAARDDGSGPASITNTATIENIAEFAGPDPTPSNNVTSITTTLRGRD